MTFALNLDTRTGALTIDGISMHTPAWNVLDCTPLWWNQSIRGQNLVLPGAVGTHAYPVRVHEARHSLEMAITGWVDQSGTPYADEWEGLEANIEYLRANVAEPPAAPTATRAATLVMPSGATRNADIQVTGLITVQHLKARARAILDIVIPSGRFA